MAKSINKPVRIPPQVELQISGREIHAKGPRGQARLVVHEAVDFRRDDTGLMFSASDENMLMFAGTMHALAGNLIAGVTGGFEKKLELVGVGYRAQMKDGKLNLQLGFSHPVYYEVPEGVSVELPTMTEIVVKGIDKQKVGQVAAEIRAFRPPEPYKGKGVRYSDERIIRKEGKKK